MYLFIIYIIIILPEKKKKGFWQKASLSLEGGSCSKGTRGAKLH